MESIIEISELRAELSVVNEKLNRLEVKDSHIDSLSKSFYLGRVGGSGRNNYRLNKRRESYLNKTIEAAKSFTALYKRKQDLEREINFIESGEQERRIQRSNQNEVLKAEYWKSLKVGDELNVGNPNGNPIITKKNLKSCETGTGCKWTAAEIIGKRAAALLQS